MNKKKYTEVKMTSVAFDIDSPILASSIIVNSTIKSTGQEIGAVYDFSSIPTGEAAGKFFNHEWE